MHESFACMCIMQSTYMPGTSRDQKCAFDPLNWSWMAMIQHVSAGNRTRVIQKNKCSLPLRGVMGSFKEPLILDWFFCIKPHSHSAFHTLAETYSQRSNASEKPSSLGSTPLEVISCPGSSSHGSGHPAPKAAFD